MKKLKNLFLFILIVTIYGCESDGLSDSGQTIARDVKTHGDLEFTYQVTNMEGNSQSTFTEGENFMFSFVVKNHGDEDIMIFEGWWLPNIFDDFFVVYKKNNGNKELIGKSFKIGGNSYDGFGQGVPAHSEIEYRIPWLTQKDIFYIMPIYRPEKPESHDRRYRAVEPLPQPLPTGQYYSSFSLEHQDEEISFAISFVIK